MHWGLLENNIFDKSLKYFHISAANSVCGYSMEYLAAYPPSSPDIPGRGGLEGLEWPQIFWGSF